MQEHDWFPRPLPGNIVIGQRSWCYSSFAFLHYRSRQPYGLRVGHDTGIYDGTFFELGTDGQVEIGNYATLVGVIICTNGRITIGDYAFLAHEVVLADEFAARPHEASASSNHSAADPGFAAVISIGLNSWIGTRAILLGGCSLGEGSIVAAGALVNFVVPPFAIVAGNPARVVGWTKRRSG